MGKRRVQIILSLLLVFMLARNVWTVQAWENDILFGTILGDSIAKGYSGDKAVKLKCYGEIVIEKLAEEAGISSQYTNYAKNGLDSKSLNEIVLVKEDVLADIARSDVVFLTIGSNDLMNEFKNESQRIMKTDEKFRSADAALTALQQSVKENPLLVIKIIDALSNWDYATFEQQWVAALDTITANKKQSAQLVVTNIYNPTSNMELPGSMNAVVEKIIANMNGIIEKHAGQYGYQVVDLFQSDITAFAQLDGLHPNQDGQMLIAGLVKEKLIDPDSLLEEVTGTKIENQAEQEPIAPTEEKEAEAKTDDEAPATAVVAVSAVALLGVAFAALRKGRR